MVTRLLTWTVRAVHLFLCAVVAVVVGSLVIAGLLLFAPGRIGATIGAALSAFVAAVVSWHLLIVLPALVFFGFWIYNYFAMEAPDECGLFRIRRRYLDKNPHVALGALASYHAAKLTRSTQMIPDGVSHASVTYSPRTMAGRAEQALLADAAQEAPIQLPVGVRVSDVLHLIPPRHIAYGHQVQDGKVRLCTVPFNAAFHSLWHGRTRSGKTNGINAMIYGLHVLSQQRSIQLYGADFKMQLLAAWERSPLFVEGIQAEIADIAELLDEWVHGRDGVRARSKLFVDVSRETGRIVDNWEKYEEVTGEQLPLKVLIVDEVNSTMEEADTLKIKTLEPNFKQAAQMGAGNGMFLFSGTQRITGVVGPDAREQFTTRAHFGHYDSAIMLALYGKLPNHDALRRYVDGTQGRGVIQTINHPLPVPLQALKCDEPDILDAIQLVKRRALSDEQEARKSAVETPGSDRSASEDAGTTPEKGPAEGAESASNASDDSGVYVALPNGTQVTNKERRDILFAANVEVGGKKPSRRAVSRAVYGTDGGPAYQKVKYVLDQAEL